MSDEEKQVVEELSQAMGWSEPRWKRDGRTGHLLRPCEMQAFPPGAGDDARNKQAVFPPSRLDGNGVLWLVGKAASLHGVAIDVYSYPENRLWEISVNEVSDYTQVVYGVEDIPAAANLALLEYFRKRGP